MYVWMYQKDKFYQSSSLDQHDMLSIGWPTVWRISPGRLILSNFFNEGSSLTRLCSTSPSYFLKKEIAIKQCALTFCFLIKYILLDKESEQNFKQEKQQFSVSEWEISFKTGVRGIHKHWFPSKWRKRYQPRDDLWASVNLLTRVFCNYSCRFEYNPPSSPQLTLSHSAFLSLYKILCLLYN